MKLDVEITGTDKLLAKAFFPTADFLENPHDVSQMAFEPSRVLCEACNSLHKSMIVLGASYIMPEFPLYYFYPYTSYKLISEIINEADKCLEVLSEQFPSMKNAFSLSSDEEILDYIGDHLEKNIQLPGIYLIEIKLEIRDILMDNNRICELKSRIISSFDLQAMRELAKCVSKNKKLAEYYSRKI